MKLALAVTISMATGAGCGGGNAAGGAQPGSGPAGSDPAGAPAGDPAGGGGDRGGSAPTATPAEPAAEPRSSSGERPRPPDTGRVGAENATILAAHNRVRALHCARPLAWSEALAATAQEWANALRDSGCRFEHSQTAYGENLAAGTRLSGENAVELWYAEVEKYNYKKHGFSSRTGHFTQVVWAASRSLGCGFSECQGMRLWVCHYDPAGNVMTLFPDNVSPGTCK